MAKKHLQHIKSSQANKIPTAADLMYGEIAVNYANGSEQLFIKNSSDEIVPFVSGKVIEENEMAIAAGMAQLNEDIENVESSIEELSQTVEDNELVTAGALTQLNEDIENVTSSIENVESSIEELSQTVEDNEYVVAEAIGNIDNDVKTLQVSVRNLENGVEEMNSVIVENEEVTATALNDLNGRMSNLDLENMVSVTWQELVNLKNDSELKAGKFYRITDYVTTTSQENTQSAGHQFDIIVLALSDNQLSEDAYATFNDNDDYFLENGANLNAWKIKYCLDNDTDRFAWAQDSISEYLPDYWIQYDRDENEWVEYNKSDQVFIQFDSENMRLYATNPEEYPDEIDELDYFQYEDDTMEFNGQTYYVWRKYDKDGSGSPSSVISQDYAILTSTLDIPLGEGSGTGVIYYMKDEWGNEAPYDFKNIQFKRDLTDGVLDAENGTSTWVYTFNYWDTNEEEVKDASIIGNTLKNNEGFINGVYNNKIGAVNSYVMYYGSGYNKTNFALPDNVFLTKGEDLDYYGCYHNTFGDDCYSNTFGNDCYSNTFGNGCGLNTFADDCYSNTFGNYCYSNTFRNYCNSNTFGDYCNLNTFEYYCYSNTFGNYCRTNTFSKPYTQYVIVEDGNKMITLTSTQTPTSLNPLCNIKIAQGVNNTLGASVMTISHDTLNDNFSTTYVNQNSVTVSV